MVNLSPSNDCVQIMLIDFSSNNITREMRFLERILMKKKIPKIHLVQNDFMIDYMKQKNDNYMYVETKMTTKSPPYNIENDPDFRYKPLEFDFYRYKNEEYLYTVGFPVNWVGELRTVGPVNEYDFSILGEYVVFLEKTYEAYEGVYEKLNGHFYIKGDDPNIEEFLSNFLTKDDLKLRLSDNPTEVYKDQYFYFICTDLVDRFEYWYIVMCPSLPNIYMKQTTR